MNPSKRTSSAVALACAALSIASLGGRSFDRAALDEMLREVEAAVAVPGG